MSTAEQRQRMGATVINFEARRDKAGLLTVYRLPPGDGGGTYEVAGINDRYHPALAAKLKALVEAGKQKEAEAEASAFIIDYTKAVQPWHSDAGVEFYLRDCAFNRGPTGAARILQMSVGVAIDGDVGPQTLAAVAKLAPHDLLDQLRAGREAYERSPFVGRDESSAFWKGLVNRWNNALAAAIRFSAETTSFAPSNEGPKVIAPVGRSLVAVLLDLLAAWFGRGKVAAPAPPAPPAAGTIPAWHIEARKDLGFHEVGANHGIDAFIRDGKCGADGQPYCAAAANAWLERAGIPGTRSAMARSFETSPNFVRLSGPAIGAIMTFWRVSKASGSGHVGQYAGEDPTGPICLGANQQDGVNYAHADMSRSTGYFWPKGQPLPKIGPVKVSGIKALAAGKEV